MWEPVIVTWEDAFSPPHENESSRIAGPYRPLLRRSIGFLIIADKERVSIVMDDDRSQGDRAEGDCETVTIIPRGMVRDIVYLTESRKRGPTNLRRRNRPSVRG